MRDRRRDLNARQRRFVAEYIACRNATEAARRAGYSEAGSGPSGFKQLQKPAVLEALRAAGIETGDDGALLHPHWRDADGLNPRQRRFVTEYARSRNAKDAARRAGYTAGRAAHTGSALLRLSPVMKALRKAGIAIRYGQHPQDQQRAHRLSYARKTLMPRQRAFIAHYLVHGKGGAAAIHAGYTRKNAASAAWQLLQRPLVKAAIAAERAKLTEKTQIDGARVLAEYARIAFASVADFLDWGPEGVRLKPGILDADLAAAVLQVTLAADGAPGNVRITMQPKLQALAALGKHLGLWEKPAGGAGAAPRAKPTRSAEQQAAYERLRERIRSFVEAAREAAAKKAA